ncbi:hypothetical protein OCU04_001085 [Sclerotinia nivalis]|uniref:DUF7587 domain-containing protein n=1 Tax=Sclerotinia nivalis TaxID=352851 RepID=A0A9X0DPD7_9HELO|nr:hypothetical protein OCU04_001085 [Sclerotinia nivalis]
MDYTKITPLPRNRRPSILFRVEHSGNSSFRVKNSGNSSFNKNDSMLSRNFQDPDQNPLPPTHKNFHAHLAWDHTPTPFLSFFNTWSEALKRRNWLLNQKYTGISIIAIKAQTLSNLYSAYEVATLLGYPQDKLGRHRREYLVWGGIPADDYRILAIFDGDGSEKAVSLFGGTVEVVLPGNWARDTVGEDLREKLLEEIYILTGVWDVDIRNYLMECMA